MGLAALLVIQYYYYYATTTKSSSSSGECVVSLGAYKGHQYTTKETLGRKCLVESKWMRIQQHKVMLAGQSTPIVDWLWIDYHDRINVLVEAPPSSNKGKEKERQFYVFQQSKYALEDKSSLAIIGGIIEPGERPERAAFREVEEEMQLSCTELQFLGRFRTDVNRGMGWVNSYLAAHCTPTTTTMSSNKKTEGNQVVGTADVERQDLKTMSLTELREAAREGAFVEVQWSNTVALALLYPELASSIGGILSIIVSSYAYQVDYTYGR